MVNYGQRRQRAGVQQLGPGIREVYWVEGESFPRPNPNHTSQSLPTPALVEAAGPLCSQQ